jgi:hypothetical protein
MLEAPPVEERGGNSHFTGGAARRNLPWSVCRAMPQPGPGGAVTQFHNLKAARGSYSALMPAAWITFPHFSV